MQKLFNVGQKRDTFLFKEGYFSFFKFTLEKNKAMQNALQVIDFFDKFYA